MKTKSNICTKKLLNKTLAILNCDTMTHKYIKTHQYTLIHRRDKQRAKVPRYRNTTYKKGQASLKFSNRIPRIRNLKLSRHTMTLDRLNRSKNRSQALR